MQNKSTQPVDKKLNSWEHFKGGLILQQNQSWRNWQPSPQRMQEVYANLEQATSVGKQLVTCNETAQFDYKINVTRL